MATKRYTPLDDPPSASSDDDETEDEQEIITQKAIPESSSEETEEEEESEEEEAPAPIIKAHEKPKIQNPNSKPAELSSEEESESDSEGEKPAPVKTSTENPKSVALNSSSISEFDSEVRSPTASDFAIKPSVRTFYNESPQKTPVSKRLSSGLEPKDKKKIKVSNGDVDEEKKAVSKKVWSEGDELLLLQGFIDYQAKVKCSPLSDMDDFYQVIMNLLPGPASKSQLYEKIRRLKKKFRVTSEKAGNNGADPMFSKVHERQLFELSNKIWGKNGCETLNANAGGGSNVKAKPRMTKVLAKIGVKEKDQDLAKVAVKEKDQDLAKVAVKEKDEDDEKMAKMEDFETLYPYWNAGLIQEVSSALKFPAGVVNLVKENLSLIGEAKAKEMNEKWEALFENETALRKRRIALLSDIGK